MAVTGFDIQQWETCQRYAGELGLEVFAAGDSLVIEKKFDGTLREKCLGYFENVNEVFNYLCGYDAGVEAGKLMVPPEEDCSGCKIGYPLYYHGGYGWFHSNTNGGPDLECINPDITKKPNPDDEEDYELT